MNHFRRIAHYDVRPLKAALAENAARWGDNTFRQDHPLSPHPSSETIFLRWAPGPVTAQSVLENLDVVDLELGRRPPFSTAIHSIASFADGRPARAIIVKMHPGGSIKRHIDEGKYAEATDRFHLPIQTNPDAWLRIGDECAHLDEGEIWWFDKHSPHDGGNDGAADRIHLIVDVFRDPL